MSEMEKKITMEYQEIRVWVCIRDTSSVNKKWESYLSGHFIYHSYNLWDE